MTAALTIGSTEPYVSACAVPRMEKKWPSPHGFAPQLRQTQAPIWITNRIAVLVE
jgi:hypothetical protein